MCVFVCMYVCLYFPGSKMDAGCQKDPDASISDHLSCSCLSLLCDCISAQQTGEGFWVTAM